MRILSSRILRKFCKSHPDVKKALKNWFYEASRANWRSPADIKAHRCSASILANNGVVFNIRGNNYRLMVKVHYKKGLIVIKFIGTHAEYDKVPMNGLLLA
ncbi:type II toxin-antitoxin system HigB family toxin [Oscillatoria sp. FACHB-1406]|uniref:type II toxin-antitoxin system HigB family toxin n=1 Tax=Oscillatoria sp. FACHB-1406 TaxID=2692846 RepID=UPI001685B542|nr:type II toxin-antitoxin system HigB family toxin [Oscillatoria sp. FACHB-1406]MBD2578262.1 type II toxin-antitoxin system HigB family toxin [Oscillatoria sp. FACHB-1406]